MVNMYRLDVRNGEHYSHGAKHTERGHFDFSSLHFTERGAAATIRGGGEWLESSQGDVDCIGRHHQ
jgi:hypothetical protein